MFFVSKHFVHLPRLFAIKIMTKRRYFKGFDLSAFAEGRKNVFFDTSAVAESMKNTLFYLSAVAESPKNTLFYFSAVAESRKIHFFAFPLLRKVEMKYTGH